MQDLNRLFLISTLLVVVACNNATSSTSPNARNPNDAALAESGRYAVDTNSSISDLTKDDAKIAAEVQRKQELASRLTKNQTKTTEKVRLDQFYKCKTRLAHSYIVLDSEDAESTSLHLAERLKGTVLTISTNIRSTKLGAYEAYSVVKDKSQRLFVFFQSESDRFVYYSFMDGTKPWLGPVKLTGKIVGLPSATYNATTQAIELKVLGLDDMKLYTYTQDGDTFKSSGTPSASSQVAFDKLQKSNGSAMELDGITMNSIPEAAEPTSIPGVVMGRILQAAVTFGSSEVARATYHEEELETTKLFQSIQSMVCQ